MTQKQKKDNIKMKKIIIITGFILLLFIISAILSATIFYFQNKNNELPNQNNNILYYNEEQNEVKEENEVLIVDLGEDDENKKEEEKPNENKEDNKTEEKPKVDPPYYIKVNNGANVVTIYKKDSKGNYNTPVKAMICSIGDATPEKGIYKMSDKYTWRLLQGDVYGQYAYRITGHILFHSVPYESQDKSTLEWWEYDKLGTKASLGCIRLKVEDAKWIYDNCVPGTQVEFYSSSNPGPLGKPSAKKISSYEDYLRNWDPTDPNSNNPWKNYKGPQKIDTNTTKKPETNNNPTNNNDKKDDTNKNEITSGGSTIKKPTNTTTTDKTTNKNEVSNPTNTAGGTTSKNEISKPTNNTGAITSKNEIINTITQKTELSTNKNTVAK